MTAWLVTFLVHGTLWCGIAWLCLRLFPRPMRVPCIGRRRSQLELRVRRLLDEHRSLEVPSGVGRRISFVSLLALAPLFAPVVAPAGDASHEDRDAVKRVEPREHEQPHAP